MFARRKGWGCGVVREKLAPRASIVFIDTERRMVVLDLNYNGKSLRLIGTYSLTEGADTQ